MLGCWLVVVVLLAGCASVPERELPGAAATPEQVVEAFVDAVDDRDRAAMGVMASAQHADLVRQTWFVVDIADLDVGDSVPQSAPARARGFVHAVYVPVAMTVSGGDQSLPNGRTAWGYVLARDAPDEPWRVVAQGLG